MAHKPINILLFLFLISLLLAVFYFARPYSRLLLTVLPPSDLYKYLVQEPITIKRKTVLKNLPLKHDYVGTYFVGVLVQKPPVYSESFLSEAVLKLSISCDNNTLIELTLNRWSNRFGGPGKKEAGVILGYYKVPENIPVKLETKAVISIVSPDPLFESSFGNLIFFIRRSVDQ